MKNHLYAYCCTFLLSTLAFSSNSQTTYSLSTSLDTYTSIPTTNLLDENNPDSIANSLYSYAVYQAIPIGFNFEFLGESFDSLRMSEDGFAMFWNNGIQKGYISMFDCDLDNFMNNPAESPIYYSVEGTPGDQIFKCEIVNSGFANDMNDAFFANVQLWLYENCNEFEIRIGQSSSSSNMFWPLLDAPIIGYGSYTNNNRASLVGDPLSPTLEQSPSSFLDNVPGSGMIYHFSDCTNALESNSKQTSEIYPTITNSSITVQLGQNYNNAQIQLISITGAVMRTIEMKNESERVLDLLEYPNGVYLVQIRSNDGIETHRILKQ